MTMMMNNIKNVAKICNMIHELKPVLMMVMVQTVLAGVNVFYKLAANDGMVLPILVAYRLLFSSAFIVPLALFMERGQRPKMTWMTLLQTFFCGLFGGSLAQNLYIKALVLTSTTFVAATTNLIPAITFILAICFRMETLGWKTSSGASKIMGTVLGVGGAMLLTFYKGIELHPWKTSVDLLDSQHHAASNGQHSPKSTVAGSILAISSSISSSVWLIIQVNMVKRYPCPYSVTALTSLMGAIQAIVFGLCTERHWNDWKLGWNIKLAAAAYSGILASGLMFTCITLCVQMRGPLFVSAFNPLMLIIVAVVGSLCFNESLHLGSVLGAIFIIIGLYVVLWAKGKEGKKAAQLCPVREPSGIRVAGVDTIIDSESETSVHDGIGDIDSKSSSLRSSNGGESRHIIDVIVTPYI